MLQLQHLHQCDFFENKHIQKANKTPRTIPTPQNLKKNPKPPKHNPPEKNASKQVDYF